MEDTVGAKKEEGAASHCIYTASSIQICAMWLSDLPEHCARMQTCS